MLSARASDRLSAPRLEPAGRDRLRSPPSAPSGHHGDTDQRRRDDLLAPQPARSASPTARLRGGLPVLGWSTFRPAWVVHFSTGLDNADLRGLATARQVSLARAFRRQR